MDVTRKSPDATGDTIALNSLLRGELSAVEAYDQAISKVEDLHVLADLRKIREEHASAANLLREKVTRFGGDPSQCTGAWSSVIAAVGSTAKVIGPATALSALRQGEEHGINDYEGALKNDEVNHECKDAIQTKLLPQCRGHVEELNRLMGGMS